MDLALLENIQFRRWYVFMAELEFIDNKYNRIDHKRNKKQSCRFILLGGMNETVRKRMKANDWNEAAVSTIQKKKNCGNSPTLLQYCIYTVWLV